VRYKTSGVPTRGAGAFMPAMVMDAPSFGAGLRTVVGFPGTEPVPVDHDMILAPKSYDPKTQPSNVAPDVILPAVYIAGTRNMGPWATRGAMHTPAPLFGGNPVPEPAGAPSGIPLPAQQPASRLGGSKVIGWPRVAPVWQSVNSSGPS
jgi:hypothetical protein